MLTVKALVRVSYDGNLYDVGETFEVSPTDAAFLGWDRTNGTVAEVESGAEAADTQAEPKVPTDPSPTPSADQAPAPTPEVPEDQGQGEQVAPAGDTSQSNG